MSVGAILTMGLGTFSDVNHVVTLGYGAALPAATQTIDSLGGSKRKKRIRGPYSDPRIFEAYVQRCIAEREKPRVNVEAAVLKEALVEVVEQRTDSATLEALSNENAILKQLLAIETAKRDVQAMLARQQQIERQIEEIEDEEFRAIITILDEM